MVGCQEFAREPQMNTDEPRLWDLARVVDGGESDRYHFGLAVRTKGGLMRLEEKTALDELQRVLQERCGATSVVLYGSKARGDDSPDSDIDVMVVLRTTPLRLKRPWMKRYMRSTRPTTV
jgi:predicted nucleotidyltransferase